MSQMLNVASTKYLGALPNGTATTDTLFASATTSKPYPINTAAETTVSVYSDAGSVATVKIETAPTVSGPWFDVTSSIPITDPTTTGVQWAVPRAMFVRLNVSAWTNGNIRATIDSWTDSGNRVW